MVLKKSLIYIIIVCGVMFFTPTYAQVIPTGISIDTFQVKYEKAFRRYLPSYEYTEFDTVVYSPFQIYYYKPSTYDPATSPILWGIHGLNGTGNSELGDLQNIADTRKALIVSVTMPGTWSYGYTTGYEQISSSLLYFYFAWYPTVFKQIYRHVLARENRVFVPVHMIGFSAGGQLVSRYMLIRQGIRDSIPIRMAVSTNPYSYTVAINEEYIDSVGNFCPPTDTVYYNVQRHFPCGLFGNVWGPLTTDEFNCSEHVIQYYKENYAVLIGTADTACGIAFQCDAFLGRSRYERAKNFYLYSDSDAVNRGIVLNWRYGEVPDVAHYQNPMYNNILSGDSISLAERLLFETPYHPVAHIAPLANFTTEDAIVTLPNATVHFDNWSINSMYYFWDFGDSTTSTDNYPVHTYLYADTFTVSLTAISGTGCENRMVKKKYIIVNDGAGISSEDYNSAQLQIHPNPSAGQITIKTGNEKIEKVEVFDCLGNKTDEVLVKGNQYSYNNPAKGIFFFKVSTGSGVYYRKVLFN